jgi:hypothetical protein
MVTCAQGGGEGALRVFGHGTLTAERIRHALHQTPRLQNRGLSSVLRPGGGVGTRIEGVTLTDSPDHSMWLGGHFDRRPETWNYARWLKVFTWRANGDGITVDGNAYWRTASCVCRMMVRISGLAPTVAMFTGRIAMALRSRVT